MKRRIYPLVSLAVAGAVGVYAFVSLGRMTASVVFLVLTTLALAWVVWILMRSAQALVKEPEAIDVARATGRRKKELEREKTALLKALKELEFDYQMGKISDADYKEIGANYRARAVRVMRQLDLNAGETDYRTLVERDLANRLKTKGVAVPESKPDSKPEPKAEPRSERPSCPQCTTKNDADAEFCKKCGKKLTAEEAAR